MKKIFILGHGIMAGNHVLTTFLKHSFHTYILDDSMSEGCANAGLVDGLGYFPKFPSAIAVKKENTTAAAESISTHWICSDRVETFTDLKASTKVNAVKSTVGIQSTVIVLANSAGMLFKLDSETYIYLTEKETLTSLTTIQDKIDEKLGHEKYEIHWSACRSKMAGSTSEEILENAKASMAGTPPKYII